MATFGGFAPFINAWLIETTGSKLAPSFYLMLAAAVSLVALAAAWCQSTFGTRNPNPLYRTLFNISSVLVTVQAAGLAYRLAGGTVGHVVWPDVATPLGAATLAFFLVNSGSVAAAEPTTAASWPIASP